MLCLQAEPVALLVSMSLFSDEGSVQEIAGIQLYCRFCRIDLKHSTAIWFASSGRQREAVVLPLDHEIVIVAMSDDQLLVIVVDSGANRRGRREIQRGSFYPRISPVGMSVLSAGVKRSALSMTSCPRMSPLPSPARLKYVC